MAEWRRHHENVAKVCVVFIGVICLALAGCVEETSSVGSGGTSADMTVTADGTADSVDGGIAGDGFMSTDVAVGIDAQNDAALMDCTSFCDRFVDCADVSVRRETPSY